MVWNPGVASARENSASTNGCGDKMQTRRAFFAGLFFTLADYTTAVRPASLGDSWRCPFRQRAGSDTPAWAAVPSLFLLFGGSIKGFDKHGLARSRVCEATLLG